MKDYEKYLTIPMTEIPRDKLDILNKGPMPANMILNIEDRNLLFREGYFECEVGYGNTDDGTGYVTNLTKMKDVTKEMFEWWFAWHSLEDLRYKIWDPEDHFYARQQNEEKARNKSLPMRERTWGTSHLVLEDIGSGPSDLVLDFAYPRDFGYDQDKIGTSACASMMCANGHGIKPGQGVVAVMTHMIREIEEGVELRSRFWIGYQIVEGKALKILPPGMRVPDHVSKELYAHNIKEFTHLAAILPKLYEEEKDND